MKTLVLIIAIVLPGPGDGDGDGDDKGRRGNAFYRNEQYVDAANLYREALIEIQKDGPGSTHSGLLNNLGASLFKQGDYNMAETAFNGAALMASDTRDGVRATYNAGNAATMQEQLETALDMYTRTLLADPSNEDAKFNYEFVKRKLQDQKDQKESDSQNDDEEQQDQNQQDQDQQNQQNQDQDQDQQNQQDQQDQDQQNDQDRPEPEQSPRPNPEEMTREEAERLLQALENEEQQLLRQIQKMKVRPRRVEKDW